MIINWTFLKDCYWKYQWIIFTLFVTIHFINAESVHDPIPNRRGSLYRWCWITDIVLGAIGLCYNILLLSMMLSLDDSSKVSFYSLNVALNTIDLMFAINRLFFQSIYLSHDRFYGGPIYCQIESMNDVILVIMSCLMIVGISWVARNDLCNGNKFTENQMIQYVGVCTIYSIVIAFIAVYVPYGGYQLNSSGSFCMIPFASHIGIPIFYAVEIFIPMGFLLYNVLLTYNSIITAQKILTDLGIKEQAKGNYIKMVTKLGYFLITTLGCYITLIISSLYEWSTGQYFPPYMSATGGILACTLSSIVNPTLFFYLNIHLQEKFWNVFGKRLVCFYRKSRLLNKRLLHRIYSPRKSLLLLPLKYQRRGSVVVPIHETESSTVDVLFQSQSLPYQISPDIKDKHLSSLDSHLESDNTQQYDCYEQCNDMNYWISENKLWNAFCDHGRKEYDLENFLFYEDGNKYHDKGQILIDTIRLISLEPENMSEIISDIINQWNELESLANRLYILYIKANLLIS